MQNKDIIALLEQTGLPVAYAHFPIKEAPPPPYIAVRQTNSENFNADNIVYKKIYWYEIELCTKLKEPQIENMITDLFDLNKIPWEKTDEGFVESDGLFSIFFEIKKEE